MDAYALELDIATAGGGAERERPPVRSASARAPGEAELARRAGQGDRRAFSALYERFAPAVHAVLLGLVRPQEAADLVQEVFLSALDAIGGLDDPARVGPWLLSIARNRGRDHLRARRRPLALEEVQPPAVEPDGADEDAEEAAFVLGAIRALPEAYRETLLLRLVEGLSGPEISERTGLTHGSVRVNLHRGMKLLREALAKRPAFGAGGTA